MALQSIPAKSITREGLPLAGPALALARLGWAALALLALALFNLALPAHLRQLATVSDQPTIWLQLSPVQERALQSMGLPAATYAAYLVAIEFVVVLAYVALSLLIFARRSDDGMAIFVSLVAVVFGATSVPAISALAGAFPGWRLPVDLVNAMGLGLGLLLFYVFPDGRFVPRATLWLALVWGAWTIVWPFVPAINPEAWPAPFPFLAKGGWYATGVLAQIYRYRRYSTGAERQQTKWVILGLSAAFSGYFAFNLIANLWPPLQQRGVERLVYLVIAYPALALLPLFLAPLSLGIACLRYRLWDVDIIINRSIVYGVVTGLLGLFYFGSVVLLQNVFRIVTGQTTDLAVIVSTLAIAYLFNPLRRRIQSVIDRRFYRSKYDAVRTLALFSATLREDANADLDQLSSDILFVVAKTMEPGHVTLWLREPAGKHPGG